MEANREEPEVVTPVIIIEFGAEDLVLTWFNTKMKLYKNKAYDHVEVMPPDNELLGIIPKEGFMDLLFEKDFPADYRPTVEPETIEWFIKMTTDDLEGLEPESFNG